jgi:hypothetical protein
MRLTDWRKIRIRFPSGLRNQFAILLAGLILTGCTRTVYVDRPVEHRVEVARPCLQADDIPRAPGYALEALRPPVTDGEVVLAMREEIAQRSDYQAVLVELLRGCSAISQ